MQAAPRGRRCSTSATPSPKPCCCCVAVWPTALFRWRRRVQTLLWLSVAFVLGLGFVLMERAEFNAMIAQGAGPDRSGFLSAFFTLVGTHGTHVSIGLIWILVMIAQVAVKGLTAPVHSRLLRLGLFWHFLDTMWVGIFSIVYLPGVV